MIQATTTTATAQQWIDYELAERALFEALRPQMRLIGLDYGRQFGARVADMVDDMAGAIFGAAERILGEQGTRRVFGDAHLFAKCQKWAAWWCAKIARQHAPRPHTRFSAEAAALGRERAHATIQRRADRDASLAQCWRATGKAVDWIAKRLTCSRATVYRLFKRKCGQWKSALGRAVANGRNPCTLPSLFDTSAVENAIPNETDQAQGPNMDEIDRIGRSIPDLLRQHWKGKSPHDMPEPEVSRPNLSGAC